MKFEYCNDTIEFSLEYRKRKSIRISVEPPDSVLVVAPKGMSEDEILEIVLHKAKWITGKLAEIKSLGLPARRRAYSDGEIFMYMGRNHALGITMNDAVKKPEVQLSEGGFKILTGTRDSDILKKAMEEWYRKETLEQVKESVARYQASLLKKPSEIKVRNQKKRWGSCSSTGRLNFNLRCAMAPKEVIDYIVVHELCHLVHFNHSREFWSLVEEIMPDYGKRRDWLIKKGAFMRL